METTAFLAIAATMLAGQAQAAPPRFSSGPIRLPLNGYQEDRCSVAIKGGPLRLDPKDLNKGPLALGAFVRRDPRSGRISTASFSVLPDGAERLEDTRGRSAASSFTYPTKTDGIEVRMVVASPDRAQVVWVQDGIRVPSTRPGATIIARTPEACRFDRIDVYATDASAWSGTALATLINCEAGQHGVRRPERCNEPSAYPRGRALYVLRRGKANGTWLVDFDAMRGSRFARPYVPFVVNTKPKFPPHNPH